MPAAYYVEQLRFSSTIFYSNFICSSNGLIFRGIQVILKCLKHDALRESARCIKIVDSKHRTFFYHSINMDNQQHGISPY